jgi:uncharacterized protein YegJ (DUF2314 family)
MILPFKLVHVFIFTITISFCLGQNNTATTESGKKVILNPDGTWEYFSEEVYEVSKPSADYNCNFTKNEVDDFTGKKKAILKPEDFINHTPERITMTFKNLDFITCRINIGKIEENFAAYFNFLLMTDNAYKMYGAITKQTTIVLKLESGETIQLKFFKQDVGETDYDRGFTKYSSFVILDDATIKLLKSSPVEKVRVSWSKGFEDYPVSNPYLFINQLSCFE